MAILGKKPRLPDRINVFADYLVVISGQPFFRRHCVSARYKGSDSHPTVQHVVLMLFLKVDTSKNLPIPTVS